MAKRLSDDERKVIEDCTREGYSIKQICDLTGRSHFTISDVRKSMKSSDKTNNTEIAIPAPVEETFKIEPEKRIQDVQDDPRWKLGGNINIKRLIRIDGKKTGMRYSVSDDDPKLVIHNDVGNEFTIDVKSLEDFIDELIDISAESKNLWKRD